MVAGKCGRRNRGEEYCVAGDALSAACFGVELKLNFGADANCEDEDCGACCWKRREEDGWAIGLVGFEVMKRCGDGVWAFVRLCEARGIVGTCDWRRRRHGRRLGDAHMLDRELGDWFGFEMANY